MENKQRVIHRILIVVVVLLTIYSIVATLIIYDHNRFNSNHTHPAFNDNFIIGNTYERIVRRYGEPCYRGFTECGEFEMIYYSVRNHVRLTNRHRRRGQYPTALLVVRFANDSAFAIELTHIWQPDYNRE